MINRKIYRELATLCFLFAGCCLNVEAQVQPIALHPQNPHYFVYKDKPAILVGSGEHYGAVINLSFDYATYIDALSADKLNTTRTFTGAYVESSKAFNISNNTLAPDSGKFICPWKRSDEPGYAGGGNKFDLSQWDENYFKRLKDFIAQAGKKEIIVELALFCPFYEDMMWDISPMNRRNNVNNIEDVARTDVYTLDKNGSLLKIQEALVKKIVTELNGYDNVMFEICNEPYFGGVTMEWQHHIADVIADTEHSLPYKHLITQNIANQSALIENPHPSVSVFNFHYAWPPNAVTMNYHLNKPIGDNETGFRGNSDSTYRMEGWRFMMAGGALYNHLDYSFAPGYERGNYRYDTTQPGGGSADLRKQLSYLKKFIEEFDFVNMQPDSTLISPAQIQGAEARVLANRGKEYAVYFYGVAKNQFDIRLPDGRYEIEWLNTKTGKYSNRKMIVSTGTKARISPPVYSEDIALRIRKR